MPSREPRPLGRTAFLTVSLAVALAGCGSTGAPSTAAPPATGGASPAGSGSTAPTAIAPSAPGSSPSAGPPASPFADVPFAFSADAVLAFYEGEDLSCAPAVPSTKAAGWMVRTCQGMDDAGRPIAIGVVTDPAGRLGDGFASVTALPGEDVLEPTDALDTLAGFLGAMLGDAAATDLLPWLAGHLGDAYAETAVGGGKVATFLETEDDPTRIDLEVAGPSYLAAPAP
jgi:hypothetical protein